MGTLGIVVLIAILGLMAYVRLAPSDPAVWHVDMTAPGFAPASNWRAFCPRPGDRNAPSEDPVALLARLDAIALAAPRTTRLAGSPAEGRITWITRSLILGFPDYTTAQVIPDPTGPRLCILARQRFGSGDGGVNAARLRNWAQQLLGLNEPPDLTSF